MFSVIRIKTILVVHTVTQQLGQDPIIISAKKQEDIAVAIFRTGDLLRDAKITFENAESSMRI